MVCEYSYRSRATSAGYLLMLCFSKMKGPANISRSLSVVSIEGANVAAEQTDEAKDSATEQGNESNTKEKPPMVILHRRAKVARSKRKNRRLQEEDQEEGGALKVSEGPGACMYLTAQRVGRQGVGANQKASRCDSTESGRYSTSRRILI